MTIVEDVYEPLPLYRDVFRAKFRENAEAFFADLAAQSGVDTEANAATVRGVRAIAAELDRAESARAGWGWFCRKSWPGANMPAPARSS